MGPHDSTSSTVFNQDVTILVDAVLNTVPPEADMLRAGYCELRRIAGSYFRGQQAEHTLQPTALVHEAFMKIAGRRESAWQGESHFVAVMARAMRQILIDHARAKASQRRGGRCGHIQMSSLLDIDGDAEHTLRFDDELQRLAAVDPRQAQVVELRFIAGLSISQTARVLGVSERTVELDWRFARAWLRRELGIQDDVA